MLRPVKTAGCPVVSDQLHAMLTTRVLLRMGALFLIFSEVSSFAQLDPGQFIDRGSSGTQMVSKNQLLAPVKAMRAIERAQKEIIGGHLESAQKDIARALEIAPHFADAKVLEGAIDVEAGKYERATTLFQQAIDDDPALGGAYVGMALVLIHQGRFQAALPVLDRAEGLLPGAWFVHFAKGWAELENGDTAAALKQADFAEQIARTDSEKRSGVSYLRAMVFIHAKDMDTARKRLAEAIGRNPGGDYAAMAKKELEQLQPLLTVTR